MNIGTRPTFDGHHQTLEVNIFDFIGEIYGRRLTIGFVDRLRGEQHFSSPEALVAQMQHDVAEARSIFSERAKQKEQL
jgi:riboflavin kinase/FMN adenylyltransferase